MDARCHLCHESIGDSRLGFDLTCMDRVVEAIELAKGPAFPFSESQRSRAVALVRNGGLARRAVGGEFDVYVVPSSVDRCGLATDHRTSYVTSTTQCPCPATKPCYHRLAVLAVAAVRQVAEADKLNQ